MSDGKLQAISKTDRKFFRTLAMHNTKVQMPYLRNLAARMFPHLTYDDLVICIDYSVYPPTYNLKSLEAYKTEMMAREDSEGKNNARQLHIIERALENRKTYWLIESLFSFGEGLDCVLTQVAGSLWSTHQDGGSMGGPSTVRLVDDGADEFVSLDSLD